MLLVVAGCAQSGRPRLDRSLPTLPTFVKPIVVAEPKTGEPILSIAARERAGRVQANRVISATRGWYGSVRAQYAKKK